MFKVTVLKVDKFSSKTVDCTKVYIESSPFNYTIDCSEYREYKFLSNRVCLYCYDTMIAEYTGKLDFIVYNKTGILVIHSSSV